MRQINHVNLTDTNGKIYCCLRNKIVSLDESQKQNFCGGCKMFAGDAGGRGVECVWDDARPVSNPHTVNNPFTEMLSNQARRVNLTDHLSTVVVFGA
ncbi:MULTISPECIES: hypothetical protein [Paenibacillus]|uniref:hypothetical protein n=1 Tax=Paenibacillus TaxID=44249 RepID=UPI0022B88197|nr:hypothetical protein [Paenibacillus caseinilyticus]MCZ8523531.1 hypothetical protein [Paenibacillus caseinilyticus]